MNAQHCPPLTIQSEGVRIFLHSANCNRDAAHELFRMYCKRMRDTPQSRALEQGWHCTRRAAEKDIEELRQRGGLLHLGCARVGYAAGEYTVLESSC